MEHRRQGALAGKPAARRRVRVASGERRADVVRTGASGARRAVHVANHTDLRLHGFANEN